MAAGELHLQLSVNFPDNRKVRALVRYGRDVRALRDLYVQMCLYSKGMLSDGFVPDEQIGLLVYPDTEKNGQRDAEHLAEVGLIEKDAGGWQVTGWLDRNASKDNVRKKSAAKARGARLANHRRWHESGDTFDPDCEWCQNTDQTTDLKSDQTTDENTDQTSNTSTESDPVSSSIRAATRSDSSYSESETESETEDQNNLAGKPADRPELGSDQDPDFVAFWDAYPRKAGKGQARKAWRGAIRNRKADAKTLIVAAERFRDRNMAARTKTEFIAHPATWLNGERWLESGGAAENPAPGRNRMPWEN